MRLRPALGRDSHKASNFTMLNVDISRNRPFERAVNTQEKSSPMFVDVNDKGPMQLTFETLSKKSRRKVPKYNNEKSSQLLAQEWSTIK